MADYEATLERVRGLLAKAASTEFPAEAESFRAKADELMTKYAIEQWEVDKAERKASSVAIKKDIDISWYWDTTDPDLASLLWGLFNVVSTHCRTEVVTTLATYRSKSVPVVGMPSDVSYADMLYTHLMLQVIDQMDPQVKEGDTLESALARMKESGLKWETIYKRLVAAGLQEDLGRWTSTVAGKVNYAGKYTAFCKRTHRKRLLVTPSVHRRSFIYGFNESIRERFRSMREDQGQYEGSMALALRDYRAKVAEAVFVHFPELKPHADDCECEGCTDRRKAAAKTTKGRKPRAQKMRTVKVDRNSMYEGSSAAQNVNLLTNEDAARQRISGALEG